MKLSWDESAWADYVWWQTQDRKVLKRTNQLINDIQRNGNEGIGKPEPLKHGFQGYWSRRITDEHRLVYKFADDAIRIAACRYHHERLATHTHGIARSTAAHENIRISRHAAPAVAGMDPCSPPVGVVRG